MSVWSRVFRSARATLSMVALCVASNAAAVEPAVPVRVEYQAARGCPAKAGFLERLRLHTRKVEFSSSDRALLLDVVVTKARRSFTGKLKVVKPNGETGLRHFTEQDCAEVVFALALSAALSIDPHATLAVRDAETGSKSRAAGDDAADSASAGVGAARSASSASDGVDGSTGGEQAATDGQQPTSNADRSTSDPSGPADDGGAEGPLRPLRFDLGGLGVAGLVFLPKAMLGAGLSLGVRDDEQQMLLPLDVSLTLAYLTSRPTRGQDPLILDQYSASLSYCPVRLGVMAELALCGGLSVGMLRGQGVELQVTQRATRSYLAVHAGPELRLPLGAAWQLVFGGGLEAPVVRRAFAIDPGGVVQMRSRSLGGTARLGATLGF